MRQLRLAFDFTFAGAVDAARRAPIVAAHRLEKPLGCFWKKDG
jgi:hypothetical protein